MRLFAVILCALPLPAMAAGQCGLSLAETRALAPELAGTWESKALQAIVVTDGKPVMLTVDGPSPAGVFSLGGDDLVIENALGDAPMTLDPVLGGVQDFALPGESPLSAAELLAGLAAPAPCAPDQMPQFEGQSSAPGMGAVAMHLFVVSPTEMINVISIKGGTDAVNPTAFRAVVRFSR